MSLQACSSTQIHFSEYNFPNTKVYAIDAKTIENVFALFCVESRRYFVFAYRKVIFTITQPILVLDRINTAFSVRPRYVSRYKIYRYKQETVSTQVQDSV